MANRRGGFVRGKPHYNRNSFFIGVGHKLIPLLLLFAGLWASSQDFAHQMEHGERLATGLWFIYNGYRVYNPFAYAGWLMQFFMEPDIGAVLARAGSWTVAGIIVGLTVYLVGAYMKHRSFRDEDFYGTARWAVKKDLKEMGLLDSPEGIVFGQLENDTVQAKSARGGTVFHQSREEELITGSGEVNTLLIAPSRSGKGVSTILPTLLSFKGSVIVLDVKGENFRYTSGFRSQFSHVIRWSPTNALSACFNFLHEVSQGEAAYRDVNIIADTLLAPAVDKGPSGDASDHFRQTATDFLTGVLLHVLASDMVDKSLPGALDFLSKYDERDGGSKTMLREMVDYEHSDAVIHEIIVGIAHRQMQRPDREGGSVISTCTKALRLFEDPVLRKISSKSEFGVDSFYDTEEPISLYITAENSDLDRLSPVMRLVITLMVRRFSEGETGFDDMKLKNRVLFVLDEFPLLGAFGYLEKSLGVLPGYRVSFLIVAQSMNQISKVYGQDHAFFDHCKALVAFAPGELTSAKKLSEMAGKESLGKESSGSSGSRFAIGHENANRNLAETERNLINPDEVMKLDGGKLLFFFHGMPPYLGSKVIYFKDRRFLEKSQMEPLSFEEVRAECKGVALKAPFWRSLAPKKKISGGMPMEFVPAIKNDGYGTKIAAHFRGLVPPASGGGGNREVVAEGDFGNVDEEYSEAPVREEIKGIML